MPSAGTISLADGRAVTLAFLVPNLPKSSKQILSHDSLDLPVRDPRLGKSKRDATHLSWRRGFGRESLFERVAESRSIVRRRAGIALDAHRLQPLGRFQRLHAGKII